ncbi:KRAB-A domain-containing protein 2 [Trichonephila clavipes]|nr:KRAB-A domain-containing protein 2 [Trichonephila clavipes]
MRYVERCYNSSWKASSQSNTRLTVERANQDIPNMLTACRKDNDTNKWSECLHFVQFAKKTTYHEGICQNPCEAMFGVKAKRGIASSFSPNGQIASIETEEQLEEIANAFETKEQLEETSNTFKTEEELQKKLKIFLKKI